VDQNTKHTIIKDLVIKQLTEGKIYIQGRVEPFLFGTAKTALSTQTEKRTPQDDNTTVLTVTPSCFDQQCGKNKKHKNMLLVRKQIWMEHQQYHHPGQRPQVDVLDS
jgi:hypothetical protein